MLPCKSLHKEIEPPADNKLFAYFLQNVDPELAKSFKRVGDTYQTFGKQNNRKFVFDTVKKVITCIYQKATFNGCEYGKQLATETYCVLEENGKVVIRKD